MADGGASLVARPGNPSPFHSHEFLGLEEEAARRACTCAPQIYLDISKRSAPDARASCTCAECRIACRMWIQMEVATTVQVVTHVDNA